MVKMIIKRGFIRHTIITSIACEIRKKVETNCENAVSPPFDRNHGLFGLFTLL